MELYQIDLGVVLAGIVALSCWGARMIYNIGKAVKLAWKGKDWRFPAYELCGEVFGTMVAMLAGFWILTK